MSDTYSIVYSPEALDDLRNIGAYIADELHEPRTAKRQVNRIREAIRSLKTLPLRHELLDWEPWRTCGVRRLVVDNYIVLYTAEEKSRELHIVRIPFGAMDLERLSH